MDKKVLVVLDGNSLMNRAFYALPPMTNSSGMPTNAIYGLTTMLFKILNDIDPSYIAAAFDLRAKTFRHLEYDDYKAGRKKMPDELAAQFEPAKELLRAFNIGIFEKEGFEADDLIGTIAKRFESDALNVVIFTGDKDALQLISENTNVIITKKGITETDFYGISELYEKYGLKPDGIIDLKGLMGDASDNIPGVPGVGEKTALKLLHDYGTIEGVYEKIDLISGKKLKENLINNRESAFFSKKLATICTDVPIDIELENIRALDYDPKGIRELFIKYEFKSLIDRVKIEDSELEISPVKPFDEDLIKKAKDSGELYISSVFLGKDLIGFSIKGGYFISLDEIEKLREILEDEKIEKNTYGGKILLNTAKGKGITIRNHSFDAEIAAYLLNPGDNSYDVLKLLSSFGDITVTNDMSGRERELYSLFTDKFNIIKDKMLLKIRELQMEDLLYKVEMPLIDVLSDMEFFGFKVDRDTLKEIGLELSEEIKGLTENIYSLAGEEFNINSPKQLGVILFEKLNLPVIKKTKTGYSTDAEVLDELSSKHEIVDKILNYRQLVKLKSTYIDGLLNALSPDGRIHSSFNQTVTATGRISSTEPNLQNIPIKMEQGRRIRKAFIPKSEDYLIVSGDYSQIELRLLAHISNDCHMIDAFIKGQDIHKRTASEVFNVPMEEVTPLLRSRAKAVNFGIVYGLSDFGLSRDLKISRKEAKLYIDNYFERYSSVREYLNNAIIEARDKGFVRTMLNRIRYIPEIKSSNRNVRNLGERLAMNTPIQGSAADIIKIAMVRVDERLKREGLKSSLILQVHDELVLEVHKSELSYVKDLLKEEMENAVELKVPLSIDINIGSSWYEAK